MSKIQVMDEILANKIAAGEVIEKMMNIVKELVENSIDAKSTSIKIELKDAGTRMVKITDNGIGMDRDDATLAFSRHATSKCHDLHEMTLYHVSQSTGRIVVITSLFHSQGFGGRYFYVVYVIPIPKRFPNAVGEAQD